MTDLEIQTRFDNICKKLDKILAMQTKIAKTLHLLPVTEKEEENIQILQRKNLATAYKINDKLNDMQNIQQDSDKELSMFGLLNATQEEIYADILGDDVLGGR